MNFKRRVRDDVEQAYREEGGPEFFNEEFISRIAASARRLEGWQIWLFATQTAILGFLLVGLVSNDASISLLGISIKNAPGVKEVLLGLVATIAILIYAVATLKDVRLFIVEKVIELRTDSKFMSLAQVAAPSAFESSVFMPKQYARYLFPTKLTKVLFAMPAVLFLLLLAFVYCLSIILYFYVIADVYWNPTLPGNWSQVIVAFAIASQALGILWMARAWIPLPYRDMSVLLELNRLQETDPEAYQRRLQEVFPEDN